MIATENSTARPNSAKPDIVMARWTMSMPGEGRESPDRQSAENPRTPPNNGKQPDGGLVKQVGVIDNHQIHHLRNRQRQKRYDRARASRRQANPITSADRHRDQGRHRASRPEVDNPADTGPASPWHRPPPQTAPSAPARKMPATPNTRFHWVTTMPQMKNRVSCVMIQARAGQHRHQRHDRPAAHADQHIAACPGHSRTTVARPNRPWGRQISTPITTISSRAKLYCTPKTYWIAASSSPSAMAAATAGPAPDPRPATSADHERLEHRACAHRWEAGPESDEIMIPDRAASAPESISTCA